MSPPPPPLECAARGISLPCTAQGEQTLGYDPSLLLMPQSGHPNQVQNEHYNQCQYQGQYQGQLHHEHEYHTGGFLNQYQDQQQQGQLHHEHEYHTGGFLNQDQQQQGQLHHEHEYHTGGFLNQDQQQQGQLHHEHEYHIGGFLNQDQQQQGQLHHEHEYHTGRFLNQDQQQQGLLLDEFQTWSSNHVVDPSQQPLPNQCQSQQQGQFPHVNQTQDQHMYQNQTHGLHQGPQHGCHSQDQPQVPNQSQQQSQPLLQPQNAECQGPYLEISEQPIPEHRFRYDTEKTNGPIPGTRRKTYPKVELKNHSLIDDNFSTVIRCELYTADSQPRLHVHELKGEKNEMKVSQDNNFTAEFNNLVVIRKRISEWKINEDEKKSINPSKIRLCFQAFTRKHKESPEEACTEKIYSDIISSALPKIIRKNIKTGSWEGGDEMWLLVENIPKHTAVRFFKDEWSETICQKNEGFLIYHKSAIIFKTPQYKQRITTPTKVYLELLENEENTIKPQDILSDPMYHFTYYPLNNDNCVVSDCSPLKYEVIPKNRRFPQREEEGNINFAEEGYEKVQKIWESKDPYRLQYIKVILSGKGKMGTLQAAAFHGQTEILKKLVNFIKITLEVPGLINIVDGNGLTALETAIRRHKKDCERFLLESGAKPCIEVVSEDSYESDEEDEDVTDDRCLSDENDEEKNCHEDAIVDPEYVCQSTDSQGQGKTETCSELTNSLKIVKI